MREHAASVDADANFPKASIEALGAAGLLGLTLSPGAGGLGATPDQYATAVAAVAEGCGSTAMVYLMHLSAANVLAAATPTGHPERARRAGLGNQAGHAGVQQKGSRSHFWAPVSGLEATDGGRRLVAEKSWVTAANWADVVVASVRSVDAAGPMDCELYLVGGDDDGYLVTGSFDKLGLRGNDSAPVDMSMVVAEGDRLGDASGGFGLMMQVVLPWFALGNAAVSIGLARWKACASGCVRSSPVTRPSRRRWRPRASPTTGEGVAMSLAFVAQLVRTVADTASGSTCVVPVDGPADVDVIATWCANTGNTVLAVHPDGVEIYRGRVRDPITALARDRRPGYRLWVYTNFHCNLACDYCCVASSPRADPRLIDAVAFADLVGEAVGAGVRELYITGGEPFMLVDLDEVADRRRGPADHGADQRHGVAG